MYSCPECRIKLRRQKNILSYWGCTICRGRLFGFGSLRNLIGSQGAQKLWQASAEVQGVGRPCPSCTKPLRELVQNQAEIDICRNCNIVWLDHEEESALSQQSDFVNRQQTSAQINSVEAVQLAEMVKISRKKDFDVRSDIEIWHWFPGLLGLPIEVTSRRPVSTHWTWILSLIITIIFFIFRSENSFQDYGFVSEEPFRYFGLTWITSFFLHSNIWHLVGNLYFFLVFANDVEDDLSALEFLGLVFGSHFIGILMMWFITGSSNIPMIGMSAAVFGIMGYYMMRFPTSRIAYLSVFYIGLRGGQFQQNGL